MSRDAIARTADKARRAAERATLARLERDAEIRRAAAEGRGVREIARVAQMDPTHVSQIIRAGRD